MLISTKSAKYTIERKLLADYWLFFADFEKISILYDGIMKMVTQIV